MKRAAIAVVLAMSLVLAACGDDDDDGATTTTAPDGGAETTDPGDEEESDVDLDGTLRVAYDLTASERGAFTFQPNEMNSPVADLGIFHWIYGGLMRPTPDGALEFDLAEAATVVDGTTIEITLRDGVTLPDGSALDAETVKAQLDANLSDPDEVAFKPEFFSLESVEVTGPLTLTLTIPDGTAPGWFDNFMGGVETVIVPEGTDFDAPAGAGPYRVTEYQPDALLVLERNPDYWDVDNIRVGTIEVVNATDAQNGVSALGADQVDWTRAESALLDAIGEEFEVVVTPDPMQYYQFYICKRDAPLDDPDVRRALNLAIDREAINDVLFDGNGIVADALWPEGHQYYVDDLDGSYEFDPDSASDLLADAGYADGFQTSVMPVSAAGVDEAVLIIQQQWAEIGVDLEIVSTANFVQDFQVDEKAPLGASPLASQQGKINNFTGESLLNTCDYSDPDLDSIASELLTVPATSDEAVDLWAEFQEIVVRDSLNIPLLFGATFFSYDPGVLGDYALLNYTLPVPDMWSVYVKG